MAGVSLLFSSSSSQSKRTWFEVARQRRDSCLILSQEKGIYSGEGRDDER